MTAPLTLSLPGVARQSEDGASVLFLLVVCLAPFEHLNISNQEVKSRILRERQWAMTTAMVKIAKIQNSPAGID